MGSSVGLQSFIHSCGRECLLACLLACLPFNHTPAEVERGRQRESEGEEWEMTTVKDVVGVRERQIQIGAVAYVDNSSAPARSRCKLSYHASVTCPRARLPYRPFRVGPCGSIHCPPPICLGAPSREPSWSPEGAVGHQGAQDELIAIYV